MCFCALCSQQSVKTEGGKRQDVMTLSDSDDVQTISSGSDDNKEREKRTQGEDGGGRERRGWGKRGRQKGNAHGEKGRRRKTCTGLGGNWRGEEEWEKGDR